MSSLTRRIEKQIMRKGGYTREQFRVGRNPDGSPRIIECKRGGVITDSNDDPIGYRWPARIPASMKPETRKVKFRRPRLLNGKMAGRGRRRGKHSAVWIEARKQARTTELKGA